MKRLNYPLTLLPLSLQQAWAAPFPRLCPAWARGSAGGCWLVPLSEVFCGAVTDQQLVSSSVCGFLWQV